jgi:hypothetical protein
MQRSAGADSAGARWPAPPVARYLDRNGRSCHLGEQRVFNLDRDVIQSLMYLKLSVAGHLTIFVTRTPGPFWSHRPAPIRLGTVVGTQLIATLVAVYGC